MTASVLVASSVPVAEIAAVLARLYPIESLLHVGFGSGRGELSFWKDLHPSKVVLIDAQEIDLNKHNFDGEVKALTAVLSMTGGLRDWTTSQLAAENSLLSIDAHRARWPHARGVTVETIETQTLDSIVRIEGIHSPNWLIVDLHPASEVLQGARAVLDSLDVLILRTALHHVSDWPQGSFLSDTTELLGAHGLTLAHLCAVGDDRFGVAVYIRGTYKEQTTKLLSTRDGLAKDLESVRQQLGSVGKEKSEALLARDALAQEKTALGAQIADLKTQVEAQSARAKALESANQELSATKQQLESANQALQTEKAQLLSTRDGLAKDLESVRQQLVSLTHQLESVEREKSDTLLARDALAQEKTALGAQIAELKTQIEAQAARAKALETHNQQLQSINQELVTRQALFDEELVKAEAQIDLIKDLLLRDESKI